MYKKLQNEFTGVLTGKGRSYGGSLIRPEATGYGLVYFAREMLGAKGKSFEGATVSISGSGNVAQFACEKVLDLGGIPVTMSDSSGWIHDPAGIDREKLDWIMDLKNNRRGRISEFASHFDGVTFSKSEPEPALNGLWNVNVGHNRREVKEAIIEQLDKIAYYNTFISSTNPPAIRLSAKLIEMLAPESMTKIMFGSGGSDANETALKLARQYWKVMNQPEKTKIFSLKNAF